MIQISQLQDDGDRTDRMCVYINTRNPSDPEVAAFIVSPTMLIIKIFIYNIIASFNYFNTF